MQKNFILTLITVLSVAGLVHAGKSDFKKSHVKISKERDLKSQLLDNPVVASVVKKTFKLRRGC